MFLLLNSFMFCFSTQTKLRMEMSTKEEEAPIRAPPMVKKQEVKHQKEWAKPATVGAEFSCLS